MNAIRLAAALAALALIPAAAQAQATLTACYVPKTGTVYRIRVEGAPNKCSPNHVEFSWETSGGAAAAPVYFPTTYANAFVVPPGETAELKMSCPASQALVLGGYIKHGPDAQLVDILANSPDGTANTWIFRAHNHGTEQSQVGTFIRCFELLAGS